MDRLAIVERDLENLTANLLSGVLSPTLQAWLSQREAEKATLGARIAVRRPVTSRATVLLHPTLLRLFEEKIERLRTTLNEEAVRGEAA